MMDSSLLYRTRHSASHVLAQAVLTLFPDAKLGIGPPIDTGFYYDFDVPRPFTPEDLVEIEELMRKTIEDAHSFSREELTREDAQSLFLPIGKK